MAVDKNPSDYFKKGLLIAAVVGTLLGFRQCPQIDVHVTDLWLSIGGSAEPAGVPPAPSSPELPVATPPRADPLGGSD